MTLTDHYLFVVQALAGVLALIPVFFYLLRPVYRASKRLFHKIFVESLIRVIKQIVLETIHPYIRELIPNGGSSLNDTIKLQILPMVKETKYEVEKQGKQIARLEGRFEQYDSDFNPRGNN